MSGSRNRFSHYEKYDELANRFHELVKENSLISFDELKTIIQKIFSFYAASGNGLQFRKLYTNEIFRTLSTETPYKFWIVMNGKHPAQLSSLIARVDQVITILQLMSPASVAKDIYTTYFAKTFPGLDVDQLFAEENNMDVEDEKIPTKQITQTTQKRDISALVAQVFTVQKQGVLDSLSTLSDNEQVSLINGVLYEVHNKRAILPADFFPFFPKKMSDFNYELGILSSVANQYKEEEAILEFYDILSEESKALLMGELVSHAEQLSSTMLSFCVKNWSDSVSFSANTAPTAFTISAEQLAANQHPFIAFLYVHGERARWDEETFDAAYTKVSPELYFRLTVVLREFAYQDWIVIGYEAEREKIIRINSVLNEDNFSSDDCTKMLACETSFLWMSPAWHETAIHSLWQFFNSFGFHDHMHFQKIFFEQFDKITPFENRLLLIANFLKSQAEVLGKSTINFDNFQYLICSPGANELDRTKVLKLIRQYAKLSITSADEFSTFIRTYVHPRGLIANDFYGISMLHLVQNVVLSEDDLVRALPEEDQKVWKTVYEYVQYFDDKIKKNDLRSYDALLRGGATIKELVDLLKKFKGRLNTPQSYLQVIQFMENKSESSDVLDSNTVRELLHGKLNTCLQSMILEGVDSKFTIVSFLVACCQFASDSSVAYKPYNRGVGIRGEDQDMGDDSASVASKRSALTNKTKGSISNLSQATFYTHKTNTKDNAPSKKLRTGGH